MRTSNSGRGSVLITALILSAIVAIFLTSYMTLVSSTIKLANRSFYSNAAMNLVDTGLEQGLWSLNYNNGLNANSWTQTGFTAAANGFPGYQATFPSAGNYYTLSGGVKGQIKVWANPNLSLPIVVAKAIVTLNDGTTIIKMAKIYLTKSSYFKNGLVAKHNLTLSGGPIIDGWNSDPSGTYVPYSASAVDQSGIANGKIGSDGIITGNGHPTDYGYAAVGGNASSISGVAVDPYGSTTAGYADPNYVTYDFTASFPDQPVPSTDTYTDPTTGTQYTTALNGTDTNTISSVTTNTTLPQAGDTSITQDGVTTYYYYTPTVSLNSNQVLTIAPGTNVVIITTTATGTTVSSGGNSGGISVPGVTTTTSGGVTTTHPASSLQIYTSGDVSISGQGVMNGTTTTASTTAANPPVDFQIYGTRSAADAANLGMQSFSITGNGVFSGIIYAPNADIKIAGGGNSGQALGAIVGNNVTMDGQTTFHYDESLASFGNSGWWSLSKWRELYASIDSSGKLDSRSTYSNGSNLQLDF
jgi:hypothetical protein